MSFPIRYSQVQRLLGLPFTWDFANGLGVLSGSNLSIVANKLVITPTLGAEMWDAAAAAFTSGTYAWVAEGANTIANVGNALEITYVNDTGGAYDYLADVADLNANLVVETWYSLQCSAFVNAGSSVLVRVITSYNNSSDFITSTTPVTINIIFRASHITDNFIALNGMSADEVVTLDNLSLKSLALSTMLAGSIPASRSNVIVKAAWNIIAGTQAGVAARLDSLSNPQNGLYGYHDGTNCKLDKLVAGTWTNVITAVTAYSAGKSLEIRLSGSSAALYYNDAQVGATQNVTDPSLIYNRLHAPFSTDPANTCASFSITAN